MEIWSASPFNDIPTTVIRGVFFNAFNLNFDILYCIYFICIIINCKFSLWQKDEYIQYINFAVFCKAKPLRLFIYFAE